MRDANNIRDIENIGIDWMGFVCYNQSPRFVNTIPAYMPTRVKRVGVFVNMLMRQIFLQVINKQVRQLFLS